jgi:hypothetical protein
MSMKVYILFTSRNHGDRMVFGIYVKQKTAVAEQVRLEATGKYECSILATTLIHD